MNFNRRWLADYAFRYYLNLAEAHPGNPERRYGWAPFSRSEMEALYRVVAESIPKGASKVLEIGSGGGHFAKVLREVRPELGYRGIDLVPANVAEAKALLPDEDFRIGNVTEYLVSTELDWDFIVSIGCAFYVTDRRSNAELFSLINAKASRGFILLVSPQIAVPSFLAAANAKVTETSVGLNKGGPLFSDAELKGEFLPLVAFREGFLSDEDVPVIVRDRFIERGGMNLAIARQEQRKARVFRTELPKSVEGVKVEGGLVSGFEPIALVPEGKRSRRSAPPPILAEIPSVKPASKPKKKKSKPKE